MSRPERRRWLAGAAALCAGGAWAQRASTAGPRVSVVTPPLPMPGLGRTRTLRVYVPPGYAGGTRRYPVIYMHDGQNLFDDATAFAGEWGVDETMDALARDAGLEAIVVGIDNGGAQRIHELSPWPNPRFGAAEGVAYLDFVVGVVKPFVDRHWRTRPGRTQTAIVGSSLGALVSHDAICRHGAVFGMAGLLSPSYWFSDEVWAATRRHPPRADARIFLYCGGREGDEGDHEEADVRRMHALLASLRPAPALALQVAPAAHHDEAAWRAVFPQTVRWLFGA